MPQELDILILGAGWTATFLIPLLRRKQLSFAATTRDGRQVADAATLKWSFDPKADEDDDLRKHFAELPPTRHVLITFPLTGRGQSAKLVRNYTAIHSKASSGEAIRFIQLGSTGIWQIPQASIWVTRTSPYDITNARAVAEDELLSLGGSVLNLAGLWGGQRNPADWVDRVAKTKEDVQKKKSLHLVHGEDVARAIVAVMGKWALAKGQRYMLTDGIVYDWWTLFAGWADRGKQDAEEPSQQAKWVFELLQEEKVAALPRSMEALGRCYDGRDFWTLFATCPLKARV